MIDICSCWRSPLLNAFSWRVEVDRRSRRRGCGASGTLAIPSRPWQTRAGGLRPLAGARRSRGDGSGRRRAARRPRTGGQRPTSSRQAPRARRPLADRRRCGRPRRRSRRRPAASRRAAARCRPGGRDIRRSPSASPRRTPPVSPAVPSSLSGVNMHARADRLGAVPRAVLGGEDAAAVLLRELRAGVEQHAEIGGMRGASPPPADTASAGGSACPCTRWCGSRRRRTTGSRNAGRRRSAG